ncbi:hypothetical protein KJ564_15260 [bacterium]|nr:hypothetical protein [bacterium]MBU1882359.1 hypothetical protein [bacterium]
MNSNEMESVQEFRKNGSSRQLPQRGNSANQTIKSLENAPTRQVSKPDVELQKLFEQYIEIKSKLNELEDRLALLKPRLTEFMTDKKTYGHQDYFFTKGVSRRWQYSNQVEKLEEQLKAKRKDEIDNGIAKVVTETHFVRAARSGAEIRKQYPRHGSLWSKQEEHTLHSEYQKGVEPAIIAQMLQRHPSGITKKLKDILQRIG